MKIRLKWKAVLLAVLLAAALHTPGTVYAKGTQEGRICGQSEWVGYYEARDGGSLTVQAVSEDMVFLEQQGTGMVLCFTNQEKTEAQPAGSGSAQAVYTLNRESILVNQQDENGIWKAVTYVRKKGQYTWLEPQSGVRYWMQANGSVLKDSVTPDGWYVGSDGCWDPHMGMGPFASGTYLDETGGERWEIAMDESLTLEDWRLKNERDKRVVGLVDYYYRDDSGAEASRTEMRLINTMEGYVVVDTAGQIAAYLYPVGDSGRLMLQQAGEDGFKSLMLAE